MYLATKTPHTDDFSITVFFSPQYVCYELLTLSCLLEQPMSFYFFSLLAPTCVVISSNFTVYCHPLSDNFQVNCFSLAFSTELKTPKSDTLLESPHINLVRISHLISTDLLRSTFIMLLESDKFYI